MPDKPIGHSDVKNNGKKTPENTGTIADFTEALRKKTFSVLAEEQHPEVKDSVDGNNVCDIFPATKTERRNIKWANMARNIIDFVMNNGIEIDSEE